MYTCRPSRIPAGTFVNSFELFSRNRALLPIPSGSFPGTGLFYEFLPAFLQERDSFVNSCEFFSRKGTLLRIPSRPAEVSGRTKASQSRPGSGASASRRPRYPAGHRVTLFLCVTLDLPLLLLEL